MKRIYVKEEWCLGCHLCEYNCAFANSGKPDMTEALKRKPIFPRIHIEEGEKNLLRRFLQTLYRSIMHKKLYCRCNLKD